MTLNEYYALQNRMKETIEAIFKETFKKIAKCVRFYKVKRKTFSEKLHEKNSRSARITFNKRFINVEEHSLMIYIQYYDEKNLSIISNLLTEAANVLIHAKNFSTKSIENLWFKRFLKRHFEMKKRHTKSISAERKDVYKFKELKIYFKQLNKILNEHKVIASNT